MDNRVGVFRHRDSERIRDGLINLHRDCQARVEALVIVCSVVRVRIWRIRLATLIDPIPRVVLHRGGDGLYGLVGVGRCPIFALCHLAEVVVHRISLDPRVRGRIRPRVVAGTVLRACGNKCDPDRGGRQRGVAIQGLVVQTTRQPAAVARWSRDSLLRQADDRRARSGREARAVLIVPAPDQPRPVAVVVVAPHPEPERLNRVRNKLALARDRDVDLEPAGCIGRSAKSATRKYNSRASDRGSNHNCLRSKLWSD